MRADRGAQIYNSQEGRRALDRRMEGISIIEQERVRAPCAEPTPSVGLWDLSKLIQGGQGAKSLDATSRWCRPPSMAGEQGWSGAAMRPIWM